MLGRAQAAIDLLYFRAVPGNSSILLEWETGTELDTAGFYVQRGLTQNGSYQRISPFIFAKGDSLAGAVYQYLDTSVQSGTIYWYRLEEIDTNQSSNFFGPIMSGIGIANPSPSPTLTRTSTPTLTATKSGSATATLRPTRTATQVPSPTETQLPTANEVGNPTATQNELQESPPATSMSSTVATEATVPATATETLLPLPPITVAFPATVTPIQRVSSPTHPARAETIQEQRNAKIKEAWLLYVIVILWGGIGWFFFHFIRKSK